MARPKEKSSLYVGGIAEHVTPQMLYDVFSTFGDVVDVQLPRDLSRRTPHRGFAFIEFSNSKDANSAIDNMHLNEFEGKTLRINIAKAINRAAITDPNRAIWTQEGYSKEYGGEKEGDNQDQDGQELNINEES